MSLGLRIKQYLHTLNDGAFAKEIRQALKVEHSDLMSALLELSHEVIQCDDSRWYLDMNAKLEEEVVAEEPQPAPVVEPSTSVVELPITKLVTGLAGCVDQALPSAPVAESPVAKGSSKIESALERLREKQREGEGPFTYAQFAQMIDESLRYVRGMKQNISKYRPHELALWDSMIVVQDVLQNLKHGPRAAHPDHHLGLGAYRWKKLRSWLAEEQVAGRGPYTAKEICGRWCPVATLRQTQRAVTALRQQGQDDDKKLAEQMIVYANPAFQKPALPDATAIQAALDDVRMKIIPQSHPMAERWKVVCEGLNNIMKDLGLDEHHLTRVDLQGMAKFFGEMSGQNSPSSC